MAQAVLKIESLPTNAVEAASSFYANDLAAVSDCISGDAQSVVIVLPPAAIDHDDWRKAAVRDLARAYAPVRINMIGGSDETAISATLAYLRDAPGITGQYLPAHD